MSRARVGWPALLAGVLLLAALQLWLRPLLPVDETRYLSVAWEMWWRGDFLVPWLNGEPYSHKPPLLFWLIHALWSVFGVSELAARAIPVVLNLAALGLSARLAARLWPEWRDAIVPLVPWLLMGGLFWNNFFSLVQFDLLLVPAALLAWHGVLEARQRPAQGWLLAGLAIGLGVLAKGPVILVPVLPAVLFAPWWAKTLRPASWLKWYLGGLAALLLGACIALAWAIPAGIAGGEDYRRAIFWGQSAGRIVGSFAHRGPWWSYLLWLPLMWLPWLLWPRLWGALRRVGGRDDGLRFCVAVLVPALLVFSVISGKQGKYLLPLFPLIAMLLARALAARDDVARCRPVFMAMLLAAGGGALIALPWLPQAPGWLQQVQPMWGFALLAWGGFFLLLKQDLAFIVRGVALGAMLWTAVMYLALVELARPPYQLEPVSRVLSGLQTAGHRLAWLGKYHGQFHFLGRLQQRIEPLADPGQLRAWLSSNPDGYLLVNEKSPPAQIPGAMLVQSYRSGSLVVWPAAVLLREPWRLDALSGSR